MTSSQSELDGPGGRWRRLEPATGQTWLSLMPPDADDYTRLLFRLFHEGIVEPWVSETESLHLVLASKTAELDSPPSTPGPSAVMVSDGQRLVQQHSTTGQALD